MTQGAAPRPGKLSELVNSGATVLIALAAGPLAGASAAATELVRLTRASVEASGPARLLRRQVAEDIENWAKSENIDPVEAQHGMDLAKDLLAKYGLDEQALVDLNFKAALASQELLARAKADDPILWGAEPRYDVAARAIQATYQRLLAQLLETDPLLRVVQSLRNSTATNAAAHEAQVEAARRDIRGAVDEIREAQVSEAPLQAVMEYLEARIRDWDVSVWHPQGQAVSAVEQPLGVQVDGRQSQGADQEMESGAALVDTRFLVVLGGPGSGKTDLARRYARTAAHKALTKLRAGGSLDDVELPLFTTWDHWSKKTESTSESLVEASFSPDSGTSDLGRQLTGQLGRTYTRKGQKVLVVLDSLDEAAAVAKQFNRLQALEKVSQWRVVVTSRPAAWDATYRGDPHRADAPRVVTLRELRYPEGVEAFVVAWFATDRKRGQGLLRQIRDRPELARAAVVPLMLTFYCLLTEQGDGADRPLPARRHSLYRRLVSRLLVGDWATAGPGSNAAPELGYCERLLTAWAWHAVAKRTTGAGIGDWGDTFEEPRPPKLSQRRALDNVAPTVSTYEGRTTRRFIHRTILEHLVAEHIATLSTKDAADLLLPHLWFDPDWKVTAPAAIVAHNQAHPGALLQTLLPQTVHPGRDWVTWEANHEIDLLLLAIAEESDPDDWTAQHQDLIHACRVRHATEIPGGATAHWGASNAAIRGILLDELLRDRYLRGAVWAAENFAALRPAADERARFIGILLEALGQTYEGPHTDNAADAAGALPALHPTAGERAAGRRGLITAMLDSIEGCPEQTNSGALGSRLANLIDTSGERAETCTSLLDLLGKVHNPREFAEVVWTLAVLQPTGAERADACAAVLKALLGAEGLSEELVPLLLFLRPSHAELATAKSTLLAQLNASTVAELSWLIPQLVELDMSEDELAGAFGLAMGALRVADRDDFAKLAWGVRFLISTEGERSEVIAVLIERLRTVEIADAASLLWSLEDMNTSQHERAEVRKIVCGALPTADPRTSVWLARHLIALAPSKGEKREIRSILEEALAMADRATAGPLALVLAELLRADGEELGAHTILLGGLAVVDPDDLGQLAHALGDLDLTGDQQRATREAVMGALRSYEGVVEDLCVALAKLSPTDAECVEAQGFVVLALTHAHIYQVERLMEALSALVSTWPQRASVAPGMLAAIAERADLAVITPVVDQMLALNPTKSDLVEAQRCLGHALQAFADSPHDEFPHDYRRTVLRQIRAVSTLQSWLGWLAGTAPSQTSSAL